ncbi:MAG: enoyl-CoA hydratase, partial [Dehalococcoidia bacterium]|nr:enoyl-CoA hydratase [Dehalococcoidia bacterium]
MDFKELIYTKDQGIATITFNRPQSYNSLARTMIEELVPAVEDCRDDPAVRVVIITGAGKAFCSGGNLQGAKTHMEQGLKPSSYFLELTKPFHRFITDIRLLPKPVIAAVNGPAAGAGFSIALACDLRIVSERAVFKLAYTSVAALVPDGGWTIFMPRLVGLGLASELIFLDRPIDAAEALKLGLVHRVVPDNELAQKAKEMALQVAAGPARSLATAKALLNSSMVGILESQLERERLGVGAVSDEPDFREAIAAFFEKR